MNGKRPAAACVASRPAWLCTAWTWGMVCLLSLLLVGCGPRPTTEAHWQSLDGPRGAFITSLAADPNDPRRLYAGMLNGGVLESRDGGWRWYPLEKPFQPSSEQTGSGESERALDVSAIRIAAQGQTFIATLGKGIYARLPGSEWIPLRRGLPAAGFSATDVAVGGPDGTSVYAGTQAGLYVLSGDVRRDTSWARLDPWSGDKAEHIQALFASQEPVPRLYAGTQAGFYRSLDGGTTWERATQGIDRQVLVIDLAVAPEDIDHLLVSDWEGHIYHSGDGGLTWQMGQSEPRFASVVEDVEFSTSSSGNAYAVTYRGEIYISRDGGLTWELDSTIDVPALSLLETPEGRLLVGTDGYGIRIREPGAGWKPAEVTGCLLSVSALLPRGQDLYAGTECCGVFRLAADGEWSNENNGLPLEARFVTAMAADDENLYIASTGTGVHVRTGTEPEWTLLRGGLPPEAWEIHSLVSFRYGGQPRLLAGTASGLYRLEGTQWVRVAGQQLQEDVGHLLWEPGEETLFATATGGQFYASHDGGQSWRTEVAPEGRIESLTLATAGGTDVAVYGGAKWTLFAQTEDGTLYYRHDADERWQQVEIESSPDESISIFGYPAYPDSFLLVRRGSDDELIEAAVPPPSTVTLRFQAAGLETAPTRIDAGILALVSDPHDNQTLYIGTANNGVHTTRLELPSSWARIPAGSWIKRLVPALAAVVFLLVLGWGALLLFVFKPPEPVELAITVRASGENAYRVEIKGPGETRVVGETSLVEPLPKFTLACSEAFLDLPGGTPLQEVGGTLFNLLLGAPSLYGFYSRHRQAARRSLLRLRLDLDDTLAGLPWELLYDHPAGEFLALIPSYSIVREASSMELLSEWKLGRRIRVLAAATSPQDQSPLLIDQELAVLDEMDRSSVPIKVRRLKPPSPAQLLKELPEGFQILHFVGHAERQALILEDEEGMSARLPSETVATALSGTEMRLLFLNACNTASEDSLPGGRSLAYELAAKGVPLVVAMQHTIPDRDALLFVRTFYKELVATGSVELAANKARRAIRDERTTLIPPNWAIPVVLMRGQSSDLLRPRHWLWRRLSLRRAEPRRQAAG